MKFRQMSNEEKMKYSKQFSFAERKAYRKGKRNGWLEHYHNNKNNKRNQTKNANYGMYTHNYSEEELNRLFDNNKKSF